MQLPRRLSKDEIETLARFNSERARGIVHTSEWQEKMFDLQLIFDTAREYHVDTGRVFGRDTGKGWNSKA